MTTVKNIYDYINSIAPFTSQEEWDNSGFLIGEWKKEVKKCVVTLDITKEIVSQAKEIGADLIVSHHPVIFSKLRSVYKGTPVYDLISSEISVISAHTNFDIAEGGINDILAAALELKDISFCEGDILRFGELAVSMTASEFASYVKEKLHIEHLRYSNSREMIKKIAVCGGAGSDFLADAMKQADAFVTGDASYHTLLDAGEADFCLVAAGHYETENIGVKALFKQLSNIFPDVEFLDLQQPNPVYYI